MEWTIRQLAKATPNNPKGLGIIPIHVNNLNRKVDQGKLVPSRIDEKIKGYKYRFFNERSIKNYSNATKRK